MASIDDFLKEWHSAEPFVMAHTSGSTGTPKAIKLLKSDMLVSARATNSFFGIDSRSTLALPLSPEYIAGKMMAVRACEAGCKLLELPVSNDVRLPEAVDLLAVVPSQIPSVLDNCRNMIRHLLVGGAPMTCQQEVALAASGISAWIGYGMTETCSHVALRRVGGDGIYQAMPSVSFAYSADGCLEIHSSRFSWDRLATRDVVELISPTQFRWLGRADNTINSGGIKIHPEQIESTIIERAGDMPPFYLTSSPDDKWGEALVMVVAGGEPDSLWTALQRIIPDSRWLPKQIICVDALPHTSNGKLLRLKPDCPAFSEKILWISKKMR